MLHGRIHLAVLVTTMWKSPFAMPSWAGGIVRPKSSLSILSYSLWITTQGLICASELEQTRCVGSIGGKASLSQHITASRRGVG